MSVEALQKVVEACVPDADIAAHLQWWGGGVDGRVQVGSIAGCEATLCELGDKIMEEEQGTEMNGACKMGDATFDREKGDTGGSMT